jgi:hypothetical protein
MSTVESEAFMDSFWSTIYGTDRTMEANKQHPERYLFVANTLFRPFSEIMTTVEMMECIPIYVRNFPFKKHGVSKTRYIQYHVGNYFVEVGNLRNRLILFVQGIKKAYRNANDNKKIAGVMKSLNEYIISSFKGVQAIRDEHIHQFRYTGVSVNRLSTLELCRKFDYSFKQAISIDYLYESAFREGRRLWSKHITGELKVIQEILDNYFKIVIETITSDRGIIYPADVSI